MSASDMNRRQFIRLAGGATLGLTFISLSGGCESNLVEPITTGQDIDFITPQGKFYYKNGADISIANWKLPLLTTASWQLKIDGLVGAPLTVTYQDLMNETAKAVKLLKTMRCVIDSNEVQGLIGTAVWTGIPLSIFLNRAVPDKTRTKRFRIYGADGFTNNIKLDRMYGTQPTGLIEPLLVYEINGQPLTPEHGFPVRMIVHEGFGYKNVKWINRIEATATDTDFGTYQDAAFVDDGVMRVVSRMTDPIAQSTISAGPVRCLGFAVSGADGVSAVDFSVDGNPYQPAALQTPAEVMAASPLIASVVQISDAANHKYPYRGVWVKWSIDLDLVPGEHTIRIRAKDRTGAVQPDQDSTISDGVNAVPMVKIVAV